MPDTTAQGHGLLAPPTAAGTPYPSPRPASAPLPPDVERLHEVWADLRSLLDSEPPNTAIEFAKRAQKLWSIVVQGLETVQRSDPDDEELKAVLRESKGRQRVVKSAALAATSADIEEKLKAFAESAEKIRELVDPKVLERALDLTFSGKRRYQPTYADSAPSAARSPYAFCTNTWKQTAYTLEDEGEALKLARQLAGFGIDLIEGAVVKVGHQTVAAVHGGGELGLVAEVDDAGGSRPRDAGMTGLAARSSRHVAGGKGNLEVLLVVRAMSEENNRF
ncbi:hypothetical protein A1Q2_06131 [Trichosporon asahii var. asahii CBS 8904]|uniref:Uncharacterized protein n=1 Tax=Trichosporon asahii var. asahii (strain CBS 8904) TaxID=1220162 RepID=K1VFM9_TRIAC|nr:hypothetical protein A1Q2_06131 [Trichosporon asahii var. asahii CBS 8904]